MDHCASHDQPLTCACFTCQAFMCKECAMTHGRNDLMAFKTDFIQENYYDIQEMGECEGRTTFRVKSKLDGKLYAIKQIKNFDSLYSETQQEILDTLRGNMKFESQHTIRVLNGFQSGGQLYWIMEPAMASILHKFKHTLKSRKLAVSYLVQIVQDLKFLHDQGIVHTKLKPNNILICPGEEGKEVIKIADWKNKITQNDIHIFQKHVQAKTNFAQMYKLFGHLPPEFLTFDSDLPQIDKEYDIWSLGCLIHLILTDFHPVLTREITSYEDLEEKLKDGSLSINRQIDKTIYGDIIRACLRVQPKQRISLETLLLILLRLESLYNEMEEDESEVEFDKSINDFRAFFYKCIRSQANIQDITIEHIRIASERRKNGEPAIDDLAFFQMDIQHTKSDKRIQYKFDSLRKGSHTNLENEGAGYFREENLDFRESFDERAMMDIMKDQGNDPNQPKYAAQFTLGTQRGTMPNAQTFDQSPINIAGNRESIHDLIMKQEESLKFEIENGRSSNINLAHQRQKSNISSIHNSQSSQVKLDIDQEKEQQAFTAHTDDSPPKKSFRREHNRSKKDISTMGGSRKITIQANPTLNASQNMSKTMSSVINRSTNRMNAELNKSGHSARKNTSFNMSGKLQNTTTPRSYSSKIAMFKFQKQQQEREDSLKRFEQVTSKNELKVEKAHTGIVWQITQLSATTFATCSVDKTIKLWSLDQPEPTGVISAGVAVNSIVGVKYKHGQFAEILAGTFQGDLLLVSVAECRVIEEKPKEHGSYISRACTLNVDKAKKFACTVSFDCLKVWMVRDTKVNYIMSVPLNFTNDGNYRWWEVAEVVQTWDELTPQERVIVAVASSKDSQTRVYRLNLLNNEHTALYKFKQNFHPRAISSVFSPNYPEGLIIIVGLIDDQHSPDGVLQIFSLKDGSVVERLDEHYRLCSIQPMQPIPPSEKSLNKFKQLLFVGTCDKKILQYHFDGTAISKLREVDTAHKKSIFGVAALSRQVMVSTGLDGKIMAHTMIN